MSGAGLPYRLRPHKAVDRRLFVELLNRYERWKDLGEHAYVSMAAFSMEDQKLVHRLLGIERLIAFDMQKEVVGRQRFNRPTDATRCVESTSADMVADIALSVENAGIGDAKGFIVWLDYTNPAEIGQQIVEFHNLVAQLAPNDIVRVTVNASWEWWAGKSYPNRPTPLPKQQSKALEKLQRLLAVYLPNGIECGALGEHEICVVIARSFGAAAGQATATGRTFEPLSIIRYADGQQMLTMTGTVVETAERGQLRTKLGLDKWAFASTDWFDVKFIAVPDLTARERLYLERDAGHGTAVLAANMAFDIEVAAEMPGFVDNFRRYYRHYPAFTAVEL